MLLTQRFEFKMHYAKIGLYFQRIKENYN
jgi:hypothetical protein